MAFWWQKSQPLDIRVAEKIKILLCDSESLAIRNTKSKKNTKEESKFDSKLIGKSC